MNTFARGRPDAGESGPSPAMSFCLARPLPSDAAGTMMLKEPPPPVAPRGPEERIPVTLGKASPAFREASLSLQQQRPKLDPISSI